jgi:hypothetical protein
MRKLRTILELFLGLSHIFPNILHNIGCRHTLKDTNSMLKIPDFLLEKKFKKLKKNSLFQKSQKYIFSLKFSFDIGL